MTARCRHSRRRARRGARGGRAASRRVSVRARSGQAWETGYGLRRGRGRPETRELRAARRPGRAEPPAGPDARDQRPRRARAARARDRARGLRRRRAATSTSSTPTSTSAAPTSSSADDDALGYSPPWLVERLDAVRRRRAARCCAITGNPEPELFADLDGERVGKARMREVAEAIAEADRRPRATGRSSPSRTRAGRSTVFGEPDVERLWDAVAHGRPPRRARSGRGVARAHRRASQQRAAVAERAAVRRTSATAAPAPT